MVRAIFHSEWACDIESARDIQRILKKNVIITHLKEPPRYIAGVDSSFSKDKVICVATLFKYPELIYLENRHTVTDITFPYIPGLLSFREGPAIISTVRKLSIKPDIILIDGQGIAHPEGFGIASHIGVLLNIPTIGCAKSRLVGGHDEPGSKKGEFSYLIHDGKKVGAVLRTREGVRPLFISPGHLITLKEATDIILRCTLKYRIPEPLRMADIISKRLKKELFP